MINDLLFEIQKELILRRYSENTQKVYLSCLKKYFNKFTHLQPTDISIADDKLFMMEMLKQGISSSAQNQYINAIKFFKEKILKQHKHYYDLERPRKQEQLPKVLSKEEINLLIKHTNNIKHKCIVELLYSGGLRTILS